METKETITNILTILRKSGKTVATAESITAGNIQRMLASVSGASDVFVGGVTTYRLSTKTELLGVNEQLAKQTNCVDREIAAQMALGALKLFKSDYAIATCGYAEAYPGEQVEHPFTHIAIACKKGNDPSTIIGEKTVTLSGSRTHAQSQAAFEALSLLANLLENDI